MNPDSGSKVSVKILSFKALFFRRDISGSSEGKLLNCFQSSVLGFGSQLENLAAHSFDESNVEIQYGATGSPDKSPTTVADLLKLIEDFPATLQNINEGKGVPMEVATCLFFRVFLLSVVSNAINLRVSAEHSLFFFSESFLFVNLSRGHA